ncbi:hypothetical protein [Granulicella sp. L46]|uniref:hypothetical protein n=1 Tax=Granulicella sp. L46 TaxID=1641865 RepID=UPI00131CEA6A|nr:hypothetical protein [Granulicella sp. L46]
MGGRLTLMSLDGQMEKLSALYEEKSDGELLDLYEQRDGLTEMAQQALLGVMRQRKLDTHAPFGVQEPELGAEDAVEAEALDAGEVLAYLFHDAFQAREAIRTLTEAGIEHRMLDWHVVHPEMKPYPNGLDLGLVVAQTDLQSTLGVLKEQLGLFPGAEGEDALEDGDSMAVLSMYERGEALVAARALGEAKMSYLWRDGSEHGSDLPDGETVAIEVNSADVERATQVVEDALAQR